MAYVPASIGRMLREVTPVILASLAVGLLYWLIVNQAFGVTEPWDAPGYWSQAYPISVAIAAILGFLLHRHPWLAGMTFTWAQLSLMLVTSGAGPLIGVGLLFLAILSIPPMIAAAVLAGLRARRGRAE